MLIYGVLSACKNVLAVPLVHLLPDAGCFIIRIEFRPQELRDSHFIASDQMLFLFVFAFKLGQRFLKVVDLLTLVSLE